MKTLPYVSRTLPTPLTLEQLLWTPTTDAGKIIAGPKFRQPLLSDQKLRLARHTDWTKDPYYNRELLSQ